MSAGLAKRVILALAVLTSGNTGRIFAQTQAPARMSEGAAPEGTKVTLGPVFKVATEPVPLFRVSYSYEFPGRKHIYIRGVGMVDSKGSLSYLYSGNVVEFLDAPAGHILHTANLEHPVTLMGGRAPSIPDESQFPSESRHGQWPGPGPFAPKAFSVLERTFHSGYRVYEKEQAVVYLTTYTEVPTSDENLRTQVSVLISRSAKAESPDTPFTLAFKAQERRSHTDWRETLGDPSRKTVEAFVDRLLDSLQR
jgi:hypothetical protein